MARILGVVGSPRKKGNTDVLVDAVLRGAAEVGASTETLFLGDLSIRECDGCHRCWKDGKCTKKDDMSRIYPTIIDSTAIVFGTPVYWYGPTALMKGFIDRFAYFNCPANRPGVKDKLAALAVPFEEEDPHMADPLVTFFEKSLDYLEMRLIGRVIVPGVTRRGEIRKRDGYMTEAFDLGKRLTEI